MWRGTELSACSSAGNFPAPFNRVFFVLDMTRD